MKKSRIITRREFVGKTAAAAVFTVVPRHVLGGVGHTEPSDKLDMAYIGCGILAIGQKAPAFSLMGIDHKTYTLESFNQAAVLTIVFTANHCPTAQAYEERMKELSAAYKSDEMMLVAISSNYPGAVCLEELGYSDLGDSFEDMKIRASDKEYNFPYLYDGEEQATALAYGALATPHVFIFDRERKLRYTGRIDDMEDPYQAPTQTDARNAIDALLEGLAVPVETTKAFGCSMKWKSKISWRKTLDERWKVVKNSSGKFRLINVWATWCGPCVIEFPEFVTMQRMYGQRNFEMVSVSADKPSVNDKVKAFLSEHQAAFCERAGQVFCRRQVVRTLGVFS